MVSNQQSAKSGHQPANQNAWLAQGEALFHAHNYKEALVFFEKAVVQEPKNAVAWKWKAQTQVMCLKYAESIETCNKSIQLNPRIAETWFIKSFAHGILGQYQEAMDSSTKGLELDPANKMIWCTKGQYLYALGRLEEALTAFGTALKMDPNSEYFKEVNEKVRKWLQRDGKDSETVNKVMAFLQSGGYKEALSTYKDALKVDPRGVNKSFDKDFALAHIEDSEKILKQYEKLKTSEQPQIALEFSQKEFEFSREAWVDVTIINKGKTPARNLTLHFPTEVVVKQLDINPEQLEKSKTDKTVSLETIPELAPGNQVKKLMSVLPAKLGQFPLEVQVNYEDVWNAKQNKSTIVWISVFKPSEQLPTIPGHKLLWRLSMSDAANIYVAQRSDQTRVVVKIPQFGEGRSSLSAEFLSEVRQCARLTHPGIVKIIQFSDTPYPWISMEYMAKGSLSKRIGRISIAEAFRIGIKLADALVYSRNMHITHRCISPDNVLFDAQDNPKLTNWRIGTISQKLRKNITGAETVSIYLPPERFTTGQGGIDWLSDIYQLGVLLYEMFTGGPPFQGKDLELISHIEKEPPPPPSSLNPEVPKEIDSIVLHCLAKNKKDRYQNASFLKTDLEKAAGQSRLTAKL